MMEGEIDDRLEMVRADFTRIVPSATGKVKFIDGKLQLFSYLAPTKKERKRVRRMIKSYAFNGKLAEFRYTSKLPQFLGFQDP